MKYSKMFSSAVCAQSNDNWLSEENRIVLCHSLHQLFDILNQREGIMLVSSAPSPNDRDDDPTEDIVFLFVLDLKNHFYVNLST